MIKLINYYETKAPSGDFTKIADKNVVLISVRNIIVTPRRSRFFLPDFGTSLYYYLFEQLDKQTTAQLQTEIKEQVATWEPRVSVHDVTVTPSIEEQSLQVTIVFSFNNETLEMPITVSQSTYYEDVSTDFTLPFFKPKRIS